MLAHLNNLYIIVWGPIFNCVDLGVQTFCFIIVWDIKIINVFWGPLDYILSFYIAVALTARRLARNADYEFYIYYYIHIRCSK